MSNRTKLPQRRKAHERVEALCHPGACLKADVEDMKKRTHDGVINLAGRNRRSGVRWLIYEGRDECIKQFVALDFGTVAAGHFLPFFNAHPDDCVLVVAFVESVVPAGVPVL